MQLSSKQKEFWNERDRRWNIKHGATRSGKTYLDYFVIPRSIRERSGKPGLVVLLGNTKGSLQRNIIDPLIDIYGADLVTPIGSDNTARLFGEKCYCLGADTKSHVDKLRGASIKYCYGDEITTWEPEVFEMLKSRLDKPDSRFDGTCNPTDPDNFVKKFMESDADVFSQGYGIDDNPFLDPKVKAALKQEHKGVFYDRYILGLWVRAEGLIYPWFGEEKERWLCNVSCETIRDHRGSRLAVYMKRKGLLQELIFPKITIGLDFGSTGSLNSMHAVGIAPDYSITVLRERAVERKNGLDTETIAEAAANFAADILKEFGRYNYIFYDSASPTQGARVAAKLKEMGLPYRNVVPCTKTPLESRPVTVDALLCADRLRIDRNCRGLIKALEQLRWDEKTPNIPEDENHGNINDYWDSFNYSWAEWTELINRR